jgi:hypothetical protein
MKPYLLALLGISLLAGCSGYSLPLCDSSNLADVPNLEGTFSAQFALITPQGSKVERQLFSISRLGKGRYHIDGGTPDKVSVCEIDSQLFMESLSSSLFSLTEPTYMLFRFQRNGDGSFDLVSLGVDSNVLSARGIPFRIISTKPDRDSTPVEIAGSDLMNYILIDNRGLSPEDFVQILDVMAVKFTFLPVALARPASKPAE